MELDNQPDLPRFSQEKTNPEVPPDSDTQLLEEREEGDKGEREKCKLALKKKKNTLKVVRIL